MVEVLGANVPTPEFSLSFGLGGKITILLSAFIFFLIICIAIYLIYMWRIYKYKIIIWENVGEGWRRKRDMARIIKIGRTGEELLYLRKHKVYRTAYGRKMGNNEVWFAIGQDGYWYNIVMGDLDAKMGMLDIEPIDRDMRAFYVANQRNIEQRYKPLDKFTKYAPFIISAFLILILMIGGWFIVGKIGDISHALTNTVDKTLPAYEKISQNLGHITSNLDNICKGSGITPT